LRRGWTRFSLSVSALAVLGIAIGTPAHQFAQIQALPRRANELSLAGLRPGRDNLRTAARQYKEPFHGKTGDTEYSWNDLCRKEMMTLGVEPSGEVQEIRVARNLDLGNMECRAPGRSPWRTGRNLAVGDSSSRVVALYGEPDSRSPSTKDGQRLELLYYAFDWAGADVPQVMEVLCTAEHDRKPGRVVEITLAASSL
jgi:hypothetical protein